MDTKQKLLITLGCAVDDGRASAVEEAEFVAYIESLAADANRYRAMRSILCEKDEAAQERLSDALDSLSIPNKAPATSEAYDALVDSVIAVCEAARDA